ncbi:MAG: LysE family translocator, partial [Acidimicrobiia bacterium]
MTLVTLSACDPGGTMCNVGFDNLHMVLPEYWSFVTVATLIVIVPGADMALVAHNTLAGGRSVGLRTATGTLLGLGIHAGAALVGLSIVIAASATAFNMSGWLVRQAVTAQALAGSGMAGATASAA